MEYRQHLARSPLAIRADDGLPLPNGTLLWPEPVLVGSDERKLAAIAERHGLTDWTTDLSAAPARDDVEIYLESVTTQHREKTVTAALEAGKHVYTEKPAGLEPTTLTLLASCSNRLSYRGVCTAKPRGGWPPDWVCTGPAVRA
jgi:hypothetical protein